MRIVNFRNDKMKFLSKTVSCMRIVNFRNANMKFLSKTEIARSNEAGFLDVTVPANARFT